VLTTLYNHDRYIHETITSALSQTTPPYEIIVIDDASTDNSVSVASGISHPCIQLIRQLNNLGGATTMKGLVACKGDFIAILNSDDYWDSHKLQRQLDYMLTHPTCGAVFTRVMLVDEEGRHFRKNSHPLQSIFLTENRNRTSWLRHIFSNANPFCASSVLIRKDCLNKVGPLDGRYIQLQDLEMWLRIAINGYDLHILDEELTYYRVAKNRANMSTNTRTNRLINAYEYTKLLRHFWQVRTLKELSGIFPEIEIHSNANNLLALFYLALFTSSQGSVHHLQFAVDTMFEWGANESAMNMAYSCHGFSHADYRKFIAQNPLASIDERNLSRRLKSLTREIIPYRFYHILRNSMK
jgi:glycosyltransferase involved in cell wall biosynthesis